MDKWNRNGEGYADNTAGIAIVRVSREERNNAMAERRSYGTMLAKSPDPRRQIIGRRNKAAGEIFERWISNACEFYKRNGLAHIEKTPEPFHITGKDGNGVVRGYYEKKDSRITKVSCVTEEGSCSRQSIRILTG